MKYQKTCLKDREKGIIIGAVMATIEFMRLDDTLPYNFETYDFKFEVAKSKLYLDWFIDFERINGCGEREDEYKEERGEVSLELDINSKNLIQEIITFTEQTILNL